MRPDAQTPTEGAALDRDRPATDERALGRIATLVAQGASPDDVFAAVADEVSRLVGVPAVTVGRFEPDRTITVLAAPSAPGFEVGRRWRLDGASVSATILDTGRPARGDYHAQPVGGDLGAVARATGMRSVVAVPVILDGAVWGVISAVTSDPEPLPADTEARLEEFTQLVAVAISYAESQARLRQLHGERAAVRRVARIVTEGRSRSWSRSPSPGPRPTTTFVSSPRSRRPCAAWRPASPRACPLTRSSTRSRARSLGRSGCRASRWHVRSPGASPPSSARRATIRSRSASR